MTHPSRVRMTGPLAPQQDTIWLALLERGYAWDSSRNLLRVAAHLSRWLDEQGCPPDALTASRIEAFLDHRRSLGYTSWLGPRCLEPILEPLRARGVVPTPCVLEDTSPIGSLLRDYGTYLFEDRALSVGTAGERLRVARRFFAALEVSDVTALGRLYASDISGFLLQEARSMSVGTTKHVATDLRSLLRYLHVRGLCGQLAAAVLPVAGHRLAGLPKHVPWEEVFKLVEGCDPQSRTGLRDRAVLLLLARLALRAGEVAAIELDDICWASGVIFVRGKGSQEGRLPLPEDVGEALVRYLEAKRPSTTSRKLFVSSIAPYGDVSSDTVKAVVHRACQRAGLPRRSAHRIRHTAATRMLRNGASLPAVAEALRHRSLDPRRRSAR